jgi:hypothetical protein
MTTDIDHLRNMLKLRLARDGHSQPSAGVSRLVQTLELLSTREIEQKDSDELGPFNFSREVLRVIENEKSLYTMATIKKVEYLVKSNLNIRKSEYESLFDKSVQTGLLKLKRNNGCYET